MAHGSEAVGAPYVDVDEWRDLPRRHRYVHGGFDGTHTRFSFYFPESQTAPGRFVQYLEGGSGGHEMLIQTQPWMFRIAFEDLDAYLVESNQGHFPNEGMGFADDWELFGASAASALYAKELAAEMYGAPPHHGYVFGGSGGGSRSIYCLENRPDVYDGASPHVIWSSALGSNWSPIGYWWLHARNQLAEIVDAMEPGGSGNPFATLDHDQRDALAALYRFGYPRGAESQLWAFSPWTWGFVGTKLADPGYYDDFWNAPGYLGHDDPDRLAHLIIDTTAKVRKVITADDAGAAGADIALVLAATAGAGRPDEALGIVADIDLDDLDALFGATVVFTSGDAKGRKIVVSTVSGEVLSTSGEHAPELFNGVAVGDTFEVSNRDFIAWCHLWQHSLSLELLRDENGRLPEGFEGLQAYALDRWTLREQRKAVTVPQEGGGTGHSGRFRGKMIHVNATHDAQVWSNGVVAYRTKVEADKGDATDDSYRLWWVENAPHGAPQILGPALTPLKDPGIWRSRLVDYDGVTAQALRDLVAWVEDGIAPPASTAYTMSGDGCISVEQDPARRGGAQPVASATANGSVRAEVSVGETVTLTGIASVAAGGGTIVAAEWDPTGRGDYIAVPVDGTSPTATVEMAHVYTEPGTHFASFRVGSHRDGLAGNKPYARNNARVRVVVSPGPTNMQT
jgi:hypothetical protein